MGTITILTNKKGISLILLAVIIVITGILGAGIVSFMGAKQKSYPFPVNSFKALQIANAGVEAAIRRVLDTSGVMSNANLNNISFGGGTFTTVYTTGTDVLTSTGTFLGVSRVVTLNQFSRYAAPGISFDNVDWSTDFQPIVSNYGDSVSVDAVNKTVGLGRIDTGYTFGAIWYSGANLSGNCTDGKCDFGKGIRAFFTFSFDTTSQADGFIFALTNGFYNDKNTIGGDSRYGEFIAYSGDSRTFSGGNVAFFRDRREGLGIRPPKMGVEFDTWYNGCSALDNGVNSRCDTWYANPSYSAVNHHMAHVFWGTKNPVTTGTAIPITTYTPWQDSAIFSLNRVIGVSVGGDIYFYRVTAAGTSNDSAHPPGFGGVKQETVTDNTITWKECTWRPSTGFTNGNIVVPTTPNGNYYVMCRSGTRNTGGSEPDWDSMSTTCPGSNNDGQARWRIGGSVFIPGNSTTYDDGRHTAGGDVTTNPANLTTAGDYFRPVALSASGFFGPTWAFRVEVIRPLTSDAPDTSGPCIGNYGYQIKSWLKKCSELGGNVLCPEYNSSLNTTTFDVTTGDYSVDSPTLDRVVCLSAADHANFNKFLFGWTEATGAGTQNATIRRFKLDFRK